MNAVLKRGDHKVSPNILFGVFTFFAAVAAIFFLQQDFSITKEKPTRLVVKADVFSHFVLGFGNVTADLLWIRLIQDIDYKDSQKVEKGWAFNLMDAITTLDSRYAIVYRQGATVLSILTRDGEGARILFERGLKSLPHDWEIAYKAGYHYMHELKICKRAAELFNQAADNGAPYWLHALAGRLYAKDGQYMIAKSILEDGLKNAKEEEYKKEYQKRLDQLEAEFRDPNNKTLIKGLECSAN